MLGPDLTGLSQPASQPASPAQHRADAAPCPCPGAATNCRSMSAFWKPLFGDHSVVALVFWDWTPCRHVKWRAFLSKFVFPSKVQPFYDVNYHRLLFPSSPSSVLVPGFPPHLILSCPPPARMQGKGSPAPVHGRQTRQGHWPSRL